MAQRGDALGQESLLDRLSLLLRLKLGLLLDEARVGSDDLARIGLVALALALLTLVQASPGHFRPAGSAFVAVLVMLAILGSLVACLVATLRLRPLGDVRLRRALGGAALALLGLLALNGVSTGVSGYLAMIQGSPYNNDGAVIDLYAAQQALRGHNPYRTTNIVTALADMNAPAITVTPLMDGQFRGARAYPSEAAIQQVFLDDLRHRPHSIPAEFESKYDYPAGSFLFILPFVWMGIHDMRFLYALAILAMGAYLWRRLPRALRVLVPFLLLADVPLVEMTAGGQPDPLYGIFLMIGYAEWATPWVSPLAMGVSIGTKQLAWFFLPFYVLLIARQLGWREAARRSAVMALVFLILNGPFLLWSPQAYLSGLAVPMSAPLFPLGAGLIAIFVSGVVPMIPKLVFTLLELTSWVGGVIAMARSRYLSTAGGVVLAAVPLFFAWRSLTSYFYLIPLLTVAVLFAPPRPATADDATA